MSTSTALRVEIPQYSVRKTLLIWALATLPMGLAAWVVGPAIGRHFDDGNGLLRGLLLAFTVGLVWQFLLVAFLLRREQGNLRWSTIKEALWLRAPLSPKTQRRGGRTWWALLPAIVLLAATQVVPVFPGFENRDFAKVLQTDSAQHFFSGNWGWFGLVFTMLIFNTIVGEELLFRGLLLPRMQRSFGKGAWVANGALFTLYHVHEPWTMPNVLAASAVFAGGTQRYRSAWIGIITHSVQTLIITALLLSLVLK